MTTTAPSATNMETLALAEGINLSDGHPRMKLTATQQSIIDRMPAFYKECSTRPLGDIEHEAITAFFGAMGQSTDPQPDVFTRTCYSSSTAIDLVGKAAARSGLRIGLVHPTFDNIPGLLDGHGCTLVPLEESRFMEELEDRARVLDAVFLVSPNNPTGRVFDEDEFASIADLCERYGLLLIADTSFRGQVLAAQYDTYALLRARSLPWIVVEDTGKLWPLHELKCGFLSWSSKVSLDLGRQYSDLMLSASPLILALIREFAVDARNGGFDDLRALIERNRKLLRRKMSRLDFSVARGSRISVDFARLPEDTDSEAFYRRARAHGVHLLPGGPFYWARRESGDRYVRFSLARDTGLLETGLEKINELLEEQEQVQA